MAGMHLGKEAMNVVCSHGMGLPDWFGRVEVNQHRERATPSESFLTSSSREGSYHSPRSPLLYTEVNDNTGFWFRRSLLSANPMCFKGVLINTESSHCPFSKGIPKEALRIITTIKSSI